MHGNRLSLGKRGTESGNKMGSQVLSVEASSG